MSAIPPEDTLLADREAPICIIPIREALSGLDRQERLYAHYMCRASFHGTPIILRQTSRESAAIFYLFIALYKAADGKWAKLARATDVSPQDIQYFLEYASMFLGNIGSYRILILKTYFTFVLTITQSTGDTRFIPRIDIRILEKLSHANDETKALYYAAAEGMYAKVPYRYGFSADQNCASGYYPSQSPISKENVDAADKLLVQRGTLPENTRLTKSGNNEYVLRIASSDTSWELSFPTLLGPKMPDDSSL